MLGQVLVELKRRPPSPDFSPRLKGSGVRHGRHTGFLMISASRHRQQLVRAHDARFRSAGTRFRFLPLTCQRLVIRRDESRRAKAATSRRTPKGRSHRRGEKFGLGASGNPKSLQNFGALIRIALAYDIVSRRSYI